MKVTVILSVTCALGTVPKFWKNWWVGKQKKNQDNLEHKIVEIGYNIQKRAGELKRLAFIQSEINIP